VQSKENLTFTKTSSRFDISIRTLFRWHKKSEPCTTTSKTATKIDMQELEKAVNKTPDIYQYELAELFNVSQSCIFYALRRLGMTNKKNTKSPQSMQSQKKTVSKSNRKL